MILVLGTADWNQAIATNQHYMARELATEYSLVFSESLGLRRPELNRRDLKRMMKRLRGTRNPVETSRAVPGGMSVVRPLIIPFHVPATRGPNSWLLRRLYESWISHDGPRVLWTYSPLTYGLDAIADITVYHCVDLLGKFPQISSSLVDAGESSLTKTANLAIGSSAVVCDHLIQAEFPLVAHWPNVADVAVIRGAEGTAGQRTQGRAVFAGNFSDKKVDFGLLEDLVESGVELHLAGPIAEGGGNAGGLVRDLVRKGAHYHGHLSLGELAKLYWTCSVGLIPYEINSYTKGVNPLKTFEYLAAGMNVVSTAIPAVEAVSGHVSVASERADFVHEVLSHRVGPTSEQVAERLALAERNSWTVRGEQARRQLQSMITNLGR